VSVRIELAASIAQIRAGHEQWPEARPAVARVQADAILDAVETLGTLEFAFEAATEHGHCEHLALETL